jgi:hypothetical protein
MRSSDMHIATRKVHSSVVHISSKVSPTDSGSWHHGFLKVDGLVFVDKTT